MQLPGLLFQKVQFLVADGGLDHPGLEVVDILHVAEVVTHIVVVKAVLGLARQQCAVLVIEVQAALRVGHRVQIAGYQAGAAVLQRARLPGVHAHVKGRVKLQNLHDVAAEAVHDFRFRQGQLLHDVIQFGRMRVHAEFFL